MEMKQEVVSILEEADYEYSEHSGCFDIAGRKKRDLLFLKLLGNVDSLQPCQANNLKILSKSLDASAMVVGKRTRLENLESNVVYDRFEIPTVTVKTLENILLFGESPFLYRFRGGMFAKINPEKLRASRVKNGLTQKELAEKIKITKKTVYEHESSSLNAAYSTARKIENFLKSKLTEQFSVRDFTFSSKPNEPKNAFERHVSGDMKRLGFETELVYQAPFNIIAKERFIVLSEAGDSSYLEKNQANLIRFSRTAKMPVLAITKGEESLDIPSIDEKNLRELESAKELRRLVKIG